MSYFALAISTLAIMLVLVARISWFWRFCGVLVITAATWFAFYALDITVRAPDFPWYEDTPWKQIIALSLTILGMAAKYLYDVIEERRHSRSSRSSPPPLNIDVWEFILPFLVSFIVFGAFWNAHGDQTIDVTWLVITFQNGFFWQTVMSGAGPQRGPQRRE